MYTYIYMKTKRGIIMIISASKITWVLHIILLVILVTTRCSILSVTATPLTQAPAWEFFGSSSSKTFKMCFSYLKNDIKWKYLYIDVSWNEVSSSNICHEDDDNGKNKKNEGKNTQTNCDLKQRYSHFKLSIAPHWSASKMLPLARYGQVITNAG